MAVDPSFYDEDYYQRGLETGKSNYQNYRWIPELTIPMVMTLIDYLHIGRNDLILDFGCAYGYVVKAFRLLHRQAWGFDISDYVIENTDPMIRQYCFKIRNPVEIPEEYDFCIAKDVLEHINYECIENILKNINSRNVFAVIPLENDDKNGYAAPFNNLDKSHIICEGIDWWMGTFHNSGWRLHTFGFRVDGIKDSYYKNYPKAHGFFWCKR